QPRDVGSPAYGHKVVYPHALDEHVSAGATVLSVDAMRSLLPTGVPTRTCQMQWDQTARRAEEEDQQALKMIIQRGARHQPCLQPMEMFLAPKFFCTLPQPC